MSRRTALLHLVSVCLAACLNEVQKMLLTDLCNRLTTRAPTNRSIAGHAAFAAIATGSFPDRDRVLPGDAGPPRRDPAPASDALDGAHQLRPIRSRPLPFLCSEGTFGGQHRLFAMPPCRGVLDHEQSWRTVSDAPCRAPQLPETRSPSRNQNRFHRTLVKEHDFPGPERLPSTSCSLGAAFAVSGWMRARHRSRGFATDDPASDALSPLRRSRGEGLDPSS